MIEQYILYLIWFCLFVILQGLAINGVYESFRGGCVNDIKKGEICSGNILYMVAPKFFERNKNKYWSKPFFSCVRCMSSVWGAITFFPAIIYLFNFQWVEIPLFIADVFILVSVNWYIYKKL